MTEATALILGCGYVGLRLARALHTAGVAVTGTTRTPERFAAIRAAGARPALADVLDPASLRPLVEANPQAVFDLVRPQQTGRDSFTTEGSRNVANAFAGHSANAFVYLSSTSVYGRRDGEWTDEDTPLAPTSPMGVARMESEALYLRHWREQGLPVRVCRAPGIYGPARTLRQRLESGAYRRIDDADLWVSRIHVDDLVAGLIAAWRHGEPGETYLLCDDEPVTSEEYAALTAELLSLPLPPEVSQEDIRRELSHSAFERRMGARRCANRKMRECLGIAPVYPSVREGVPAALREEGAI